MREGRGEVGLRAPVRTDLREGRTLRAPLEPAIVLPAQLDVRSPVLQPERRLMLAVLEDAVATLLAPHLDRPRERHRAREVEEWFQSTDAGWPFTFLRVCEALGLDAGCLRSGLARARQAGNGVPRRTPVRPLRRMAGARHRIGGRRRA